MSVEHMAVVLHHSRAKGTAKLVLLGIANHQGDGGAWPSVATLAKYAGVTPRNVQKALETLRGMGEVAVRVQAGGRPDAADHDRPNLYEVLVTCPPSCDRSPRHRDTRAGHQSALWKNPPSQSTPPVAIDTPRASESTPAPLSESTPKPPIEPTLNTGTASTSDTDRARELHETCTVCSRERWDCDRRAATSGHSFTPARPHRQEPRSA